MRREPGLLIFVEEPGRDRLGRPVLAKRGADGAARPAGPDPVLPDGEGLPGEVELRAGAEFPVNPQIKGAIKSLTVMDVHDRRRSSRRRSSANGAARSSPRGTLPP